MSTSVADLTPWPRELALKVEEACGRFEAAWQAGEGPRVEAYLGDVSEPGRSVLLRELLALELEYRGGRGQSPTPEEYLARFPAHAELVRKALADEATHPTPGPGAACPSSAAGRRGRFTSLRRHAQGGLGLVSVAFDETLRRQVALKEIRPDRRDDPQLRQRFLTEAEITGQLEHPGVVPIYALEEGADGQPYYAMRFIQGGTLAEAVRAYHAGPTPLAFHDLLKRFLDVCQTIAYAHSRGVIHRDLKPANVLLGDYGETLVVDWGLAKRVGGPQVQSRAADGTAPAGGGPGPDPALTGAGEVLGTPPYMSPEQAEGRGEGVGPATDVYALGAILYELLTGQPPYCGPGQGAVLAQVRGGPPPAPSQLRRGLPRALEAVCLKGMARSPAGRYPGAGEMARDVERWLADEPVTAYREPLPVRLARRARRHRTLVTAVAVVLLTLAGAAVGGGLIVARQQERSRLLAQADALPDAGPAAVPALLNDLKAHRDTVRPALWARWQDPALADGRRLRLGLALADDADVRARLVALARTADDPREVMLVRDALVPYAAEAAPLLWGPVGETATAPRERFRLLSILAALDPDGDRWPTLAGEVVNVLLRENVLHVGAWAEALRPVRGRLIAPLAEAFRDRGEARAAERATATGILADFADSPEFLADLLMDADDRQFAVLWPRLEVYGARAIPPLLAELDRKAPSRRDDEPTDPAWQPADDEAAGRVEEGRERLAKRQAAAGVALLRLGEAERVWPLLRHSPDPRVRSYLVNRLSPLGADPEAPARRLAEEPDVTIRRALLLALGQFGERELPAARREALQQRLCELYRDDPDPGIHGSAAWVLVRWGQRARLEEIDRELTGRDREAACQGRLPPGRGWYVNGQGQTMVIVPEPPRFWVGSPRTEKERDGGSGDPFERRHRKVIGRTYALAAREVTVAQFLKFQADHAYNKSFSPTSEHPVNGVTWHQAAEYCNWLSGQEGIPPDQWCYEIDQAAGGEKRARPRPDCLGLSGYRLPTNAEWECACRAGAATARYYGETDELLGSYACYARASDGAGTAPVGSLEPNDLGLFDMLGNVYEWCQGRHEPYGPNLEEGASADAEGPPEVSDAVPRVLRGGAYNTLAPFQRSAHRNAIVPTFPSNNVGVRPARRIH